MNTIPLDPTMAAAEAMLAAAGLDPTPVTDCADEGCRWCGSSALPAAA